LSPPRAFEECALPDPARPGQSLPYWTILGDEPAGPVVIFSHGWGESRQAVLPRLPALAPVCSRVVAWDLPGHGEAPPGPCRMGVNEHRALISLAEEFADSPVVLYGFSLGAGVSIAAAAAGAPVAGVIAEAPYRLPWTPARCVMELRGLPHRLNLRPAFLTAGVVLGAGAFWRRYDRAALARSLACPLLVLHGTEDEMCPVADGLEIAGAAPKGRLAESQGAAHLDLWANLGANGAMREVQAFVGAAASPAHTQ
jgi:pimeloyl-ACP methyl ester carboxylesterase